LQGVRERDAEDVFSCALRGVFDAVFIPELAVQAEEFALKLSSFVFEAEARRVQSKEAILRRYPSSMLSAYLEAFPRALARDDADERPKAQKFVTAIIGGLIALTNLRNLPLQDVVPTLYHLAARFVAMCMEDSWVLKTGGCSGIRIMTQVHGYGIKWVSDRELDLVRTLLHMLKELPYELPKDIQEVTDVLNTVLRVSHAYQEAQPESATNSRAKLVNLVGIFFSELPSASAVVRRAAQSCIALLVEISGKPVSDLLAPHRERMMGSIYTKPLRALPFPLQIGIIEAVRYCVSMNPPLTELSDELLRLLHETLGLADADDLGLLGRGNPRQGGIEVAKLRVACIKLLTASMPMTDYFAKQPQTRQRYGDCPLCASLFLKFRQSYRRVLQIALFDLD
jgi:transformation/transcription domain-associated protein